MRVVTRILFSLRPAFRDIKGGSPWLVSSFRPVVDFEIDE